MRLLGSVIIIASCLGLAVHMFRAMKQELKCLENLFSGVKIIRASLAARQCPLYELLIDAADKTEGDTSRFFRRAAEGLTGLEEKSFPEIWRDACRNELSILSGENRRSLESLGLFLGRYGLDDQLGVCDSYLATCGDTICRIRNSLPEKRRLSLALGMTAGVFLSLLIP